MRTIFFGPWIGEFGWEYSHWHAWVNEVSRKEFKNDITIASSFQGREPFYINTSKFLAHPKEYGQLFKGKRNYITDNWIDDRPNNKSFSINDKCKSNNNFNQIKIANQLLNYYKKSLPDNTIFYVPWLLNKICIDNHILKIGVEDLGESLKKKHFLKSIKYFLVNKISDLLFTQDLKYRINGHLYQQGIATYPIPLTKQNFFKLKASKKNFKNLSVNPKDKLKKNIISIFPRKRDDRRPDKNFGEEKYINLIESIKKKYPGFKVALLGEPNGSYFANGVPEECIDLINIPDAERMNQQIYILENSVMAIGSISGAMLVSLGSGCPSLIWGFHDAKIPTHDNNPLSTPLHYLSNMHPQVFDILNGIEVLKKKAGIYLE